MMKKAFVLLEHLWGLQANRKAPAAHSMWCCCTGISFHWISKFQPLSDFWAQLPETKDAATYELNRQQAAQDWLQLLRARAAELLPGGHLVATAATLKGSESFNYFADFINQVLLP